MHDFKAGTEARSVSELVDMVNEKEIILGDTISQWSSRKKRLFVMSILTGLPITPVYLLEVSEGVHEVVDGNARIKELCALVASSFFEDLTDSEKRKVRRTLITCVSIRLYEGPREFFKKDIRDRLNN